jgi:hypothetical protein
MRGDFMQGGPQAYMGRSPGIGVVPGPYMAMPGQMVPGPPPIPYQVCEFMLHMLLLVFSRRTKQMPFFNNN